MIIYKVTNLVNSKIYIGLTTKTLDERWKGHLKAYKWTEYAFHRALRKYGIENFKIEQIDTANTIEELIVKESDWIKKLDSMNPKVGYNMLYQDDHIKFFNDEIKEKIGQAQRARMALLSEEKKLITAEKMSKVRQGQKLRKYKQFVGVSKNIDINSYWMEIRYRNKRYRKYYKTEEEAIKSYDKLALYLYGELAKTNLPKENYRDLDLEAFIDEFIYTKGKVGQPRKLTDDEVNKVRLIGRSMSQIKIAKQFNISQGTISHILRNPEYLLKHEQ